MWMCNIVDIMFVWTNGDGGVQLERATGKLAKVMLYRARECLFAEYVMIGILGSRSTPPPNVGISVAPPYTTVIRHTS